MEQRIKRLSAQPGAASNRAFRKLWIIEDDAQTKQRQGVPGVVSQRRRIQLQIHTVTGGKAAVITMSSYRPGDLTNAGRAGLALWLLDAVEARSGLVVAGTNYGSNRIFIPEVLDRGLDVAVEVHHASRWTPTERHSEPVLAEALIDGVEWSSVSVVSPEIEESVEFHTADLGLVMRDGEQLRAFAFAPGSVIDPEGDLRIGVTSLAYASLADLVQCLGWARWIRTLNRRRQRQDHETEEVPAVARRPLVITRTRPNIRLAREHDLELGDSQADESSKAGHVPRRTLRVLELFAGAGGLGLGFLLANSAEQRFRILYSVEVEPIYVQTLRSNHKQIAARLGSEVVPASIDALDLRRERSEKVLFEAANGAGGIDLLIGGPPCQGFSNANRNSWSANNPNNRLVDVFLRYVRKLEPRFVLLENVQGILWTDRSDSATGLSVADHVLRSLRRSGYWTFPKLLDAVWFGVPQHRARFFLLAIHQDLGYKPDDFGDWGPFPRPSHGPTTECSYTTVDQAIGDLPELANGAGIDVMPYTEPSPELLRSNPYLALMREGGEPGVITDHLTSRHAGYVIERYSQIPPGGNWQDIAHLMTNYTDVQRTHSNIYRRLKPDEPAVTIGHYRKSMIVHPVQDRGLSLREAARLQSFPDWFRFVGSADGRAGGLMHKQQQLANAVSPLVAKAIAEFVLTL